MNRRDGCRAGWPKRLRKKGGLRVNARGFAFSGAGLAHNGLQSCRIGTTAGGLIASARAASYRFTIYSNGGFYGDP